MANLSNINNKFLVTTGGDVGIGVTSPGEKLDVGGNIRVRGVSATKQGVIHNSGSYFSLVSTGNTSDTTGARIWLGNNSSANAYYQNASSHYFRDLSSSIKMTLDSSGNVGIGRTPDLKILDLQSTSGLALRFYNSATFKAGIEVVTTAGQMIGASAVNDLAIRSQSNMLFSTGGNTERMRIDSSGTVIVKNATTSNLQLQSDQNTWNQNDVISNLNTFVSDTSAAGARDVAAIKVINEQAGTNTTMSGAMSFYTSAYNATVTERMRIDSSGNVGIGTDAPLTTLHVNQTNDAQVLVQGTNKMALHQDAAWNSNILLGCYYDGSNIVYGTTNRGAFKIVGLHDSTTQPQTLSIYGANGASPAGSTVTFNSVGFSQDEDGNVGIGTTSPSATLDVQGSSALFMTRTSSGLATYIENDGGYAAQYMYQIGAGARIVLHTNGNSYFNGGNVGIGTTSPSAKLEVRGTAPTYTNSSTVFWGGTTNNDSHNGIMLSSYGDALGGSLASNLLYSNSGTPTQTNTNRSSGQITFTNTTVASKTSDISFGGYYKGTTSFVERMRIDSNGYVTIKNNAGVDSASLTFSNSDIGIGINQSIGYLNFYSNDSSTSSLGGVGGIAVKAEEAFNTSFTPTYMSFYTHVRTNNNGTSLGNVTERMRITSEGTIEIRNGSTVGGEMKLTGTDNDFTINGKRGQVIYEIFGTQTYVMDSQQFYPSADNARNIGTGSNRFSVVYSANGVNTSDRTLKKNIKECDLGIDFINSLKPKSYNFKDLKEDNDAYGKKRYGLIAQDLLQTELKDAVFGEKDGEYGLSYNDLIAPMIKAIQELKAEIDELKK